MIAFFMSAPARDNRSSALHVARRGGYLHRRWLWRLTCDLGFRYIPWRAGARIFTKGQLG